jgi:hypothetical protein
MWLGAITGLWGCFDFKAEFQPAVRVAPALAVSAVVTVGEPGQAATFSAYAGRLRRGSELQNYDFNEGDILGYDSLGLPIRNGTTNESNRYYDYVANARLEVKPEAGAAVAARENGLPGIFSAAVPEAPAYTVTVSAPGYPAMEASAVAPAPAMLLAARYEPARLPIDDPLLDGTASKLVLTLEQPATPGDQFSVAVWQRIPAAGGGFRRTAMPLVRIDATADGPDYTTDELLVNNQWTVGLVNIDDQLLQNATLEVVFNPVSEAFIRWREYLRAAELVLDSDFAEPLTPYSSWSGGYGLFYIAGRATQQLIAIP